MIVWNLIPMIPWALTRDRSKPRTGCAGHHFLREHNSSPKVCPCFKIMFHMQISRLLYGACDFVKTNEC